MKTFKCNFCHQDIPVTQYWSHISEHKKRREDGQQTDYATLPAEQLQDVELDFESAPKWYRHQRCGQVTGMPHEIIKTYLKNPWFYSDLTFCIGCKDHVPESECVWEETGQNLGEYKNELKAKVPRPAGCLGAVLFVVLIFATAMTGFIS